MATPSEVQFDGRLTNISIQYSNPEFIADLVVPPTPVQKKQGTFKKYDKDERFTLPPALVGPESEPNELRWNLTDETYACEDYGYQSFLSQETIDNAEAPINAQSDTTEIVTKDLLLHKEKRVADAVFNASNYGASNQVDIEAGWATLSDDALTDIEVGIDACFAPPNVMVLGLATWRKLARNEKILAAVKGTLAPQAIKSPGGVATPTVNQQELAEYLGLSAVLVGRCKINTAKKGQTVSYGPVWDGTNAGKGGAALLYVKAGSALQNAIWGAQFAWKNRQIFTYQTPRGAYGGQIIRAVETNVIKVICTDMGYLFKDCLVT